MIVNRYRDSRSRTEQPASITSVEAVGTHYRHYGVVYADGTEEQLFTFDQSRYAHNNEAAQELLRAFQSFDINLVALEAARIRREQAAREAMRKAAFEKMRGAFGEIYEDALNGSYFNAFAERDFGRWNDRAHGRRQQQEEEAPERIAARAKCRKLKRLAESSTFAGERANASRMRAEIMAKHSIEEREI
jgi:hypothetical protein